MTTEQAPATWAIVELLGHVKMAGRLTEEEKFGAKMGRLDIPSGEGFTTQFFGGGSVYRITVVSEAAARHVAKQSPSAPISPWDFPKQLAHVPAASVAHDDLPYDPHEPPEVDDDYEMEGDLP